MNLLESIEVVDIEKCSYHEDTKLTLLDQIVLKGPITNYAGSEFTLFYFKDSKWDEIDQIYRPFKKPSWVHIDPEDAWALIEMIKKADISEVENLYLSQLEPKDLEDLLNPSYFSFKIQNIYYDEKDWELLNELALNSIGSIKPRALYLSKLNSISTAISILSNLPENVTLNFQWSTSYEFPLKFFDTIAYFKDKKEIIKIHWNCIWFQLNDWNKWEIMFHDKENIRVSFLWNNENWEL